MKKLFYFFMGCILLGLGLSAIFASLPVFPYTGQGFISAIAKGQADQAYTMLSDPFKQRYDLPTFRVLMDQSGIKAYKSVNWAQNVMRSGSKEGFVAGAITTTDNQQIPIRIDFIQVQGDSWLSKGWRINALTIYNTQITPEGVRQGGQKAAQP